MRNKVSVCLKVNCIIKSLESFKMHKRNISYFMINFLICIRDRLFNQLNEILHATLFKI